MIDRRNDLCDHTVRSLRDSNSPARAATARRSIPAAALSFVVAGLAVCALPATAKTTSVALPGGTPIAVSLLQPVSSHNARVGDRFSFKVTRSVAVRGWVVIRKDTVGEGDVILAEGAGRNGRPGKVGLRFSSISAADGSTIVLTADPNTANAEGRGRSGSAVTTASRLLGSASLLGLGPAGLMT